MGKVVGFELGRLFILGNGIKVLFIGLFIFGKEVGLRFRVFVGFVKGVGLIFIGFVGEEFRCFVVDLGKVI